MNFRKQQREQPPIHIDGAAVEQVESFKFLSIHITDDLKYYCCCLTICYFYFLFFT